MAELFSGKMLWRFFGPHNRQLDELGTSAGHIFLIEHHILSSIRELQHTSNILSVIFEWKPWCQSFKNKFLFCSMLVTKFVRVMRMLKNQTKLIANRYFIKVKGRKRQFLWSEIFRYLINMERLFQFFFQKISMRILFRDKFLVCKKLGEKDILHMTTKLETWRMEKLPDPWFTMGSLGMLAMPGIPYKYTGVPCSNHYRIHYKHRPSRLISISLPTFLGGMEAQYKLNLGDTLISLEKVGGMEEEKQVILQYLDLIEPSNLYLPPFLQ